MSCVIGQKDNSEDFDESSTINSLMPLNVQKRKLLLHPIIDTFVMIKYNSYAVLFLATILARLAFALLITGLTVNYPINANQTMTENHKKPSRNNTDARLELPSKSVIFWICFSLLAILTCILLASCVLKLISDLRQRCKGKTKGFFWLLFEIGGVIVYAIALVYLILLTQDFQNQKLNAVVKFSSALLVLLSWVNFTASLRFLLLGKFYCLGNYISMLTHVAKKVAIFFLLYVAVLIGFTLTFYLTLPEDFENPLGLTKTLAMMIGELDFGSDNKDLLRNIIFFVFAVAVTIVISNLLIGLTVSDVADLLEKAKMDGMEFKLAEITKMDDSILMMKLSDTLACCTNWSHMISGQDQPDQEVISKQTRVFSNFKAQVAILPNRAKPGFIQTESIVQVFEVIFQIIFPETRYISQMHRNEKDQRVIGDPWSYLGINTFVYGSTAGKSVEAAQRLENENGLELKKSTSLSCAEWSRDSTLRATN